MNSPFSSTAALVNDSDSRWNQSRSVSEETSFRPSRSPSARTLTGSQNWAMRSALPSDSKASTYRRAIGRTRSSIHRSTSAGCSAGSTIERRSSWMSPLTPMIAGCPKVRPPAGVMTASKSPLVAMAWQASVVEAT